LATAIPSVRPVAEAFTQLTGKAGARQIDGAKRFLTCNIGGSVRTSVVVVWEAFWRLAQTAIRRYLLSRGGFGGLRRCINREFPRRFQAPRRERFWRSIENS
jgi:hypothetical protein